MSRGWGPRPNAHGAGAAAASYASRPASHGIAGGRVKAPAMGAAAVGGRVGGKEQSGARAAKREGKARQRRDGGAPP